MFKKAILTTAVAGLALVVSTNASAAMLIDDDFQAPTNAEGAAANFSGWTYNNAPSVKSRFSTADVPNDANNTTNQIMQLEWDNAEANYDTGHAWAADDKFTLTLNAAPQAWNIQNARWIRPKIYSADNTLLWDMGEVAETKLFQAGDPNPYAWNGPGPYGNGDWQDFADTQFSFDIDASTFASGTEGQSIYLKLDHSGQRGMYYDNIMFERVEDNAGGGVPEPATATLALLGLGGLMMRRRRNA